MKQATQGFFRRCIVGRIISLRLRQSTAAIVNPCIHVDHIGHALNQLDRRQNPIAVQTIRIQIIGLVVRSHDKAHAVAHQTIEQTVQNHCVGNVGHMKFVKANQAVALRHTFGHLFQRVGLPFERFQFAVHTVHELVKVNANFALNRTLLIVGIHQHAFAAPHATPKIHALRNLWFGKEAGQFIRPFRFVLSPFVFALLQAFGRCFLRKIRRIAMRRQGIQISL